MDIACCNCGWRVATTCGVCKSCDTLQRRHAKEGKTTLLRLVAAGKRESAKTKGSFYRKRRR